MLLKDTMSSERPCAAAVDRKEDGGRIVRITRDVKEISGEDGQVMFQYDEALFEIEPGREETAESIQANIEDWWEFGTQDAPEEMTLAERVAMLEDYIISGGEV